MAMPVATKHRNQIEIIALALPKKDDELRRQLQDESERGIVDPAYFADCIQKAQQILFENSEKNKEALRECDSLTRKLMDEAALSPREQVGANFSEFKSQPLGLQGQLNAPDKFKVGERIYYPLSDSKESKTSIFVTKDALYLEKFNDTSKHLQSRALDALADAAKFRYGEGAEVSLTKFDENKYEKGKAGRIKSASAYHRQCDDIIRKLYANGQKLNAEQLRHIDPKVVEEGKNIYAERKSNEKAGSYIVNKLRTPESGIAKKQVENTENKGLTVENARLQGTHMQGMKK